MKTLSLFGIRRQRIGASRDRPSTCPRKSSSESAKIRSYCKEKPLTPRTLTAADQNALSWARGRSGEDFANATVSNAAGLAISLAENVNKYEAARVNRKWLDGLEKLDAISKGNGRCGFRQDQGGI